MSVTPRPSRLFLTLLTLLAVLPVAWAYYDPAPQRWINRDPLGEEGGLNLFDYVDGDPITGYDAFGLQRGGFPGPSAPAPDTCTPEERKKIDKAEKDACNRVSGPCPSSDPGCQALMDKAKGVCDKKKKPKVKCAKPGDKECAKGYCAYEDNGTVTLCGKSWPETGSNCQGDTGPMTLECILVHEILHVGQGKKDNLDDANKLQKCVGCPSGAKH